MNIGEGRTTLLFAIANVSMVHPDSPANSHSSNHKLPPLHQLKALLSRFFRRTRGFLAAKTLPRLADKTCQIFLGDAHPTHLHRCRRVLRSHIHLDPSQLHHFFHSDVGDALLSWVERFFHLPNHASDRPETTDDRQTDLQADRPKTLQTKKHALKSLLVEMAADPEGLSLLSFVRRFPDKMQLNLEEFLALAKQIEQLLQKTDATISTIQELSAVEAALASIESAQWPDLRQAGPFAVEESIEVLASEESGDLSGAAFAPLRVIYYRPSPWPPPPVPVVLQSHGLASDPEDLADYARHLVSHGYFVAAPWHSGSDTQQAHRMLAGETPDMFRLKEFIHRPLDISRLLDALEQRNSKAFEDRLNLNAVGLLGHSFGAYTALVLAGAGIQFEKLEVACSPAPNDPNLSLLLQCQALDLPRRPYYLRDYRIHAIISLDAIGSEVFGAAGLQPVQVPVMLMAGSQDATAPLMFEQVRIFHWLKTPHRYLALMHGKSHIRDSQRLLQMLNLHFEMQPKSSSHPEPPFDHYINALSLAYFQQHLPSPSQTGPPISAQYAATLSQEPFDLWLISAASSQALSDHLQDVHRDDTANLTANLTELALETKHKETIPKIGRQAR